MSWITIGWALFAAFLINAIRWGWFRNNGGPAKGVSVFLLISGAFTLGIGGLHHWHEVSSRPIQEKYTWVLFYKEEDNYYFLYKEKPDAKKISFYQSSDPKAYPKRIIKTRNYYGYSEEQVDFGTAKAVP